MSALTPINFIIDNFETTIDLDVCGNLLKSELFMDVSAVADLYIDASLVRLAFQFQTDASDVLSDLDSTDIKYFIDRDSFWNYDNAHSFSINAADAQINSGLTLSLVPIMNGSGEPTKNMVCHDFVRFLASKLFNTPYGVDLFENELELSYNIRNKARNVWGTIDRELSKYDVVEHLNLASTVSENEIDFVPQETPRGSYGPDSWKYYTNADGDNITKKILEQMAQHNPARLTTIKNTTDIQPIPFINGDTISLKLTIFPASKQEELTGVPAFGGRSFKIRYTLVDDHASGSYALEQPRGGGEDGLWRNYTAPVLL